MKKFLAFLIFAMAGSSSMVFANDSTAKPELLFNKKGKLVQVKTADGRSCVFNYAPNGNFTSSIPAACGSPEAWVKAAQ